MARISKILDKNGKVTTLKTSKSKAIKLKCLDCVGYERKNVKECGNDECKLYSYRLGKNPNSGSERSKDIKAFCTDCMNGEKREIKRCVTKYCPLFAHRKGAGEKDRELFVVKVLKIKRIKRRK